MRNSIAILALAAAMVGGAAAAQSAGEWTLGIGAGYLNPKSNNGTLAGGPASIDDDTRPIFTAEYFVWDNIGIELLAATPFSHDINIGGGYAGTTRHLPPTLSVNYHFDTGSKWKPYAGIGLNYTMFFEESSPLGQLELDDSFGVSVQAGLDYQITDRGAMRLNVRWFDINSDATLNGAPIGEADIDPILVGLSYVHQF